MFEPGKLSHLLSPVNGEDRATARSKEDLGVRPGADAGPAANSIEALIAWLRTMPPGEHYQYCNTGACLFSQFGESLGLGEGREAYFAYMLLHGITEEQWKVANAQNMEPFGNVAVACPETFGAALQRAIAYRDGAA